MRRGPRGDELDDLRRDVPCGFIEHVAEVVLWRACLALGSCSVDRSMARIGGCALDSTNAGAACLERLFKGFEERDGRRVPGETIRRPVSVSVMRSTSASRREFLDYRTDCADDFVSEGEDGVDLLDGFCWIENLGDPGDRLGRMRVVVVAGQGWVEGLLEMLTVLALIDAWLRIAAGDVVD